MKVFFDDGTVRIRSMVPEDARIFYDTYLSYGWHPELSTYEEYYRERGYEPFDINIDSDFTDMSPRVGFLHEPVLQAFAVGKDEWNDWSAILETKSEYILYRWATSA